MAPPAPTPLPPASRPGCACAGIRQSTCSPAALVAAATSLPHCAGTPLPAAATTAPAADSHTSTVSADRADRNPVGPSRLAPCAQNPAPPSSAGPRTGLDDPT